MSLRVLLIVLPTLLACRRVPASLPEPEPEPARSKQPVFVEAQPGRSEARPGSMAPVSADIAAMYRCWFRHPYEYMFDSGPALEVGGVHYGMLRAGISGILHYGDLTACAGELTGVTPNHFTDLAPLEALAGVPTSLPNPHLQFATVNPEFIAYARRHLLPPPEQTIDGIPTQLAYDRVFRRFFRLMGASLLMLLDSADIDRETRDYLADTSVGMDGIDWLEARYSGRLRDFPEAWDGTTMTAPMAAGFWLRRNADSSLAASWHGLRELLERYDPSWLAEQYARYPNAVPKLALLPDPLEVQP